MFELIALITFSTFDNMDAPEDPRITALEDEIKMWTEQHAAATDPKEKSEFRQLIITRSQDLTELRKGLNARAAAAGNIHPELFE